VNKNSSFCLAQDFLTHKAIPVAVNGSNFGKSIISKYKRVIYDLKFKNILAYLKIFLFRLVLTLHATIVAPPITVQSKNVFHKILNLSIINNEIV
jgi:hypothetical protein